jgi:two-component system NarL family sensor kinase
MNNENYVTWLLIFANAIFVFTIVAIRRLIYVNARNKAQHQLQVAELELAHEKKLVAATLEMKELTFQEISREIHDNIKQTLTLSKFNLYTLHATANSEKEQKIHEAIVLIERAIEDLGDLSKSLNTDWLKSIGLISALENEIEKLRSTGLFTIETDISEEQVVMEADRELFIFRIVQETLNNIITHSGAKKILFSLTYQTEQVCCTITDDGKGFNGTSPGNKGTGLNNMQIRAKALNARLQIDTAPGKGTTVSLSVPYQAAIHLPVDLLPATKVKAKPSFNFFQRIMMVQTYLSLSIVHVIGYALLSLFLSEQLLWHSLITLSAIYIIYAMMACKKNFDRLSKTLDAKRLLIMSKPFNLACLLLAQLIIGYSLWTGNMYMMLLPAIPTAGFMLNFSRHLKRDAIH